MAERILLFLVTVFSRQKVELILILPLPVTVQEWDYPMTRQDVPVVTRDLYTYPAVRVAQGMFLPPQPLGLDPIG